METELAEAQAVGAGGTEMECAEKPQGCTLDEDLFSGGRSKVKLTRNQKRAHKQRHQPTMGTGALDISAVELQMLQKEDPSLASVFPSIAKTGRSALFEISGKWAWSYNL